MAPATKTNPAETTSAMPAVNADPAAGAGAPPEGKDPSAEGALWGPKLEEGLRKAAVLMITLNEEVAAEVFKRLSDKEAKVLSKEIMRLGMVDKKQIASVLHEFQRLFNVSNFIREGGKEQAFNLLKKSFPSDTANRLMKLLSEEQIEIPFAFLKNVEIDTLLPFLKEEHSQTISLVLSYMEPVKAAKLLVKLPAEQQAEIVKRIATLDQTSPEAIEQVEKGLRKYISTLSFEEYKKVGGVKTVAEMMNVIDRTVEKSIMENINAENPKLSDQIKKLMFVFEDILLVDERGIQNVLKELDNKQLAMALKGSSKELQEKIFKNMSQRAAEGLKEEMSFLGPVRLVDVQAAQQAIVDVVRRLEEAGEVIIQGRGEEGATIV
ncbi:MAG: flagellar motor switch protein FliG [Planctomycetes bacterium]|nr:flagellar motor switch protein FliG [Planctomycetota bacterium]